jgi:hypothetical protein
VNTLQRVFPITEQTCREHCGKPVLIFLADGSEITGMLSRVEGGKLYLNEQTDMSDESFSDDEPVAPSKKKKVKTSAIKRKKTGGGKKVRTAAANAADPFFGPSLYDTPPAEYGGGGAYGFAAPLAFDLSAVAALFVLD